MSTSILCIHKIEAVIAVPKLTPDQCKRKPVMLRSKSQNSLLKAAMVPVMKHVKVKVLLDVRHLWVPVDLGEPPLDLS